MLDAHLDLLDTDIPSKHFICLQDVFKICLQDAFKTCLQGVIKTCQDVFRVTIFSLEVLKTFWKTYKCYAEDVLKTSSRHVFKTCL